MPYMDEPPSGANEEKGDAFQSLVKTLRDMLGPSSGIDSADIDPEHVQKLMRAYVSDEREWSRYALCDSSRGYTRNLVDEGNGRSNLLVIVWNPSRGSPVHDHANAHCVMKILKGSLKETLYSWPSENENRCPQVMQQSTYNENAVTYICDQIGLHKIENSSATCTAVSLHLYTPPHAANYGFNLFDEKTGKATHIKQAGCFSNKGERLAVCGPEVL